ncbi:MAG: sodium:solute symporter family protein [Pirellulaceae bacterium]|nr:sodium:solute symporter family protein [Pirellulaceae bacterium]
MLLAFTITLMIYMLTMYVIGYVASRRVSNVDDYVLAGRSLSLGLTTVTMVATWFGAESLMTTTDEVAANGWRGALLDPIGISLCLVLTGLFIAAPMWRLNVLTIPDFFRMRYGKLSEVLCSLVLVPSYFGWIAAQYVALATILSQLYGGSTSWWIILVALAGTGYSLMGGMWSITLTDTLQLGLILLGRLVRGYQILNTIGDGSLVMALTQLRTQPPPSFWRLTDPETYAADLLSAVSILAIGSLGNLPVQDLMQRVFSARSPRVACWACYLAAAGYLTMGMLPILAGLAAVSLLKTVPEEGVLILIASRILSPALLIIFLLAIVSAVLSTMVSAVMAPAAVLAHNLIQPGLRAKSSAEGSERAGLRLQRWCVVGITCASVALALSGRGAFELVQSAYAMSLVGMFVPFVVGIYIYPLPGAAANASVVVGILCWLVHVICGWSSFAEPWLAQRLAIPHELVDTGFSAIAFLMACWIFPTPSNPVAHS